MTNVLAEYPAPWTICNEHWAETPHIRDANDTYIIGCDMVSILEFIAETVNNSVRLKITVTPCTCACGWQGIVLDCLPDIDGDGSLGCPECETVIEVVA